MTVSIASILMTISGSAIAGLPICQAAHIQCFLVDPVRNSIRGNNMAEKRKISNGVDVGHKLLTMQEN